MDPIKKVRDRLNHVQSDLTTAKQPKLGKSHFDNQKIFALEQEVKELKKELALLKQELEYEKRKKFL